MLQQLKGHWMRKDPGLALNSTWGHGAMGPQLTRKTRCRWEQLLATAWCGRPPTSTNPVLSGRFLESFGR